VSTHVRQVNGQPVTVIAINGRPPIPDRRYDWSAVTDDYEPGHPVGHGETEEAAIADLVEQLEDANG
jgi:hypothetical protein